jgi:hypothetical protein|tara:strand:- start:1110 stop:1325 length:216 start_codon:yes stop_codon:yes gene_type:complete
MRMDNYTKKEMTQDFNDIKEHISEENLQGAAITILIDDVLEHYEVAIRLNFKNSKGHYSDLLSRLIKTYGH